jgi:DNA replicative helicase MCM subunit Mcm2 (Cdc46/Mcm family)
MKCDNCANQEICVHYKRIQDFLLDKKYGLGSLSPDIVELVVTKCQYYRRQKGPKKEKHGIMNLQGKQLALHIISEIGKKEKLVPKNEVIKRLQEKGMSLQEAEKLITRLIVEGVIFEPKEGYLMKT